MPTITLARLLAEGRHLTAVCHAPGCDAIQRRRRRWGAKLHPSELIGRLGLDPALTLDKLRQRLRCDLCGARGRAVLELSGTGPPPMGMRD